MHIDIGCHIGLYGKGPGGILVAGGYPFAGQYACSVFKGNEGLAARSRGNVNCGFFTGLVGGFVRGEAEHREGFGIPPVGAASVFGPVHGDHPAAHVTGIHIAGQNEVAAPFRIAFPQDKVHILRTGGKGAAADLAHGRAGYIGIQFALSGILPPPVPTGLEHGIFHAVALHALALGIHHSQADKLVLVGFQIIAVGYADTHIGAVRRVGKGFGGEALVAAGFAHGSDHEGLQHAGGVGGLRKLDRDRALSVAVQFALEQRMFGR